MAKIAEYGSVVCHYTKCATAFEHILAERRLRFSPYRLVRDPVESRKAVPNTQSFGNLEAQDAEMETVAEIHKAANALKWETKLLALTTDAPEYTEGGLQERMFGRGWARARMWELYGENHRGACLVFDRHELQRELSEGLLDAGVGALHHGAVRYTHTGLAGAFLSLHLDNFKTKPFSEALADFLQQHHRDLFLLKTLDWATEHEYRYLAMSPGSDYLFARFDASLKAVIVGEECPPWQWRGVLDVCDQVGVTAYRLHWLHEGPDPVELEKDVAKHASRDVSPPGSADR